MFYTVLVLSLLLGICKGQAELQYAHPPSGTVIGHVEGTSQLTINCNITNGGVQSTTLWSIINYSGQNSLLTINEGDFQYFDITGDNRTDSSGLQHYRNYLTILRFTSELDGANLYCGTGVRLRLAEYLLKVYVPPSQPYNLTVVEIGATWVSINWEPPVESGSPQISGYEVTTNTINFTNPRQMLEDVKIVMTTEFSETWLNFTRLHPNTMYELNVVAFSEVRGEIITKSNVSQSVQLTTLTTIPALICRDIPTVLFGNTINITLHWSYSHTGGLPLTNLTVTNTALEINTTKVVQNMTDTISDPSVTSVIVYNVLPGYEYRYVVTSTNDEGSTSVTCPPVVISIHTVQIVLGPIEDCETWIMSSTMVKIQDISEQLVQNITLRCNCSFVQDQLVSQTLQCSKKSHVHFRTLLLEDYSQPLIDEIAAWILSSPSISVEGVQYIVNDDCPAIVNPVDAQLIECDFYNPTTVTIASVTESGGTNQMILLVAVLASVLGALFLVVVLCLAVVCYMSCNTNSRFTNKIEVELSAWNVQDTIRESPTIEENPDIEANEYEVVADLITNPMYRTVDRQQVIEPEQVSEKMEEGDGVILQALYDVPKVI